MSQVQPGLVSVMMPAYNAERFIGRAITSLLGQTFTGWELVVVNDGSSDRTAEISRGFQDPRIAILEQPNAGEAAARNTALGKVRGEFLAFLDADDEYLPCHLERLVAHLKAHPSHDAVYSDGYYTNEAGELLQTLASRRLPPREGNIFEQIVLASCMLGPPLCVVLRRGPILVHQLHFDIGIPWGTDWDFFTRYAAVCQFGYVDEPTCLYRIHSSNVTTEFGAQRRASFLAKYRSKAIRLPGFATCSLKTRAAVFHDLLVNLLAGQPAAQSEVTGWAEFRALPAAEQARLLRLMASEAILRGEDMTAAAEWLGKSRGLNPRDQRTAMLAALSSVAPGVCRRLLRIRRNGQGGSQLADPFRDVKRSPGAISPVAK